MSYNATGVDKSQYAKNNDLANLKSEVDKLDIDKLSELDVVDLSKLSDVVKHDVTKTSI